MEAEDTMVRRRGLRSAEVPVADAFLEEITTLARPLSRNADLEPLLDRIGDARVVLLGEASHGTSEYYTWRVKISQRLIEERGFSFMAVEGDWPDCYRVTRYAKGLDGGASAFDALHAFARWPTWMWANEEVVALVEWLRRHNDRVTQNRRVGFYGLDVYSLWDSLYAVLGYLRKHRPALVPAARNVFQCFEPYGEDEQAYARATLWADETCEEEIVHLLASVRRAAVTLPGTDRETRLDAEQNAVVIKNAEHYYRTMVHGGPDSWNVRDRHMADTLNRLLATHGPEAKAIVWEHNTHIGDARYTDMADDGMVNVGQLAREAYGEKNVVLVGFCSHRGDVIAAREWESPMEQMPVPEGRAGSWEDLLHRAVGGDGLFIFEPPHRSGRWAERRGQRAIGVVYHPEFESGNYVPTVLSRRYDALVYLDETHALHPLHIPEVELPHEVPETYPTGV
jgi:erythromycin esterase